MATNTAKEKESCTVINSERIFLLIKQRLKIANLRIWQYSNVE